MQNFPPCLGTPGKPQIHCRENRLDLGRISLKLGRNHLRDHVSTSNYPSSKSVRWVGGAGGFDPPESRCTPTAVPKGILPPQFIHICMLTVSLFIILESFDPKPDINSSSSNRARTVATEKLVGRVPLSAGLGTYIHV